MTLLKLLIIFFIIFASSRVVLRYKNKEISYSGFILWLCVWAATLLAVILPDLSGKFAKIIGIGRGVDSAFFLAILLLFYLTFRLYIKLDKIDRDITTLTTESSKKFHSIIKNTDK